MEYEYVECVVPELSYTLFAGVAGILYFCLKSNYLFYQWERTKDIAGRGGTVGIRNWTY